MSTNLLGLLKDQVSGDMVSKIAGLLGESTSSTQSALGSALPSILAGAVQKASDANGASALFDLLNSGGHDGGMADNLGSLLGSGSSSQGLIASGRGILSSLFGDHVAGIADLLSGASGITKESATSLLNLAALIVFGMIGRHMKSQRISNAAGLASLLLSQREFLKGVLPAGLTSILNLSSLTDVEGATMSGASGGLKRMIPWLVLAIAALIIYVLLGRGCQQETPTVDAAKTMEEAANDVEQATPENLIKG